MKLFPLENTRFLLVSATFLFLLLCAGCKTENTLPTEVARVNGDRILYQDLEGKRTALTGVFTDSTEKPATNLSNWQYRRALQQLIIEKLLTQYLQKKKLTLANDALGNFESSIRHDYGKYHFETMLAEQGLTIEDWRKSVRNMLLVDMFKTEILRPSVSISANEIEQYYTAHKNDFSFSEQWRFLQLSALNRSTVEEAKKDLLLNKNPFSTKNQYNISIRDINIEKERLPEKYSNILGKLQTWQASAIIEQEDEFICLVMLDKTAPSTLDLLATYDRIESIIAEEKLEEAFSAWLGDAVAKSNIFIHPALLQKLDEIPDDFITSPVSKEQSMDEDSTLPAEP